MKRTLDIHPTAPQYSVVTDAAFAQVDKWYGHTRQDLKMDIIYPEDSTKTYPCVVWICGGAWLTLDRSAHLAYLSWLARQGFVVASVMYRTSNDAKFPAPLQDVKAGIRYLRAHAARYRIDAAHFGVMGESAGGYLTCMAALANDPKFDVGAYTDMSSAVQAACPWYPPTDLESLRKSDDENSADAAGSPLSLMMGFNVQREPERAQALCPISYVEKNAPPFLFIHGTQDKTVAFAHSVALMNALEQAGNEATLLALEGADHADIRFFQQPVWDEIATFFTAKLKKAE